MTLEKQIIFLLERLDSLESKAILRILENQDFTKQSIRNALAKMKQAEYIFSKNRGTYSVTKKGVSFYSESKPKDNFYYKNWNRQWLIVLIGIPEAQRKKRDTFRNLLINWGFGHLYNNVYVYPWNISESIIDKIDSLEIEDYVTILQSKDFLFNKINHEGFSGPNAVRKVWDLDKITLIYTEKSKIVKETKNEILILINMPDIDYLMLISHFLRLTSIKEELINKDPMLPPEFLPGNWIGGDVLAFIEEQLNTLTSILQTSKYRF